MTSFLLYSRCRRLWVHQTTEAPITRNISFVCKDEQNFASGIVVSLVGDGVDSVYQLKSVTIFLITLLARPARLMRHTSNLKIVSRNRLLYCSVIFTDLFWLCVMCCFIFVCLEREPDPSSLMIQPSAQNTHRPQRNFRVPILTWVVCDVCCAALDLQSGHSITVVGE